MLVEKRPSPLLLFLRVDCSASLVHGVNKFRLLTRLRWWLLGLPLVVAQLEFRRLPPIQPMLNSRMAPPTLGIALVLAWRLASLVRRRSPLEWRAMEQPKCFRLVQLVRLRHRLCFCRGVEMPLAIAAV